MIDFRAYLITDRKRIERSLFDAVEEALRAGIKAVQLREKDLQTRPLLDMAYRMRELTRRYGAKLFINERADIAMAVDADGVHLGAKGIPIKAVRKIRDRGFLIGYSAHSPEEAARAEVEGADFVTFSPVYETSSKPGVKAQGLDKLEAAVRAVSIPVFALGGITLNRVEEVRQRGAFGVAVVSAILGAYNIDEETKKFVRLLQ
jgi:thiamine-phosphate pyrophosphorylase